VSLGESYFDQGVDQGKTSNEGSVWRSVSKTHFFVSVGGDADIKSGRLDLVITLERLGPCLVSKEG
jgi:hypothetical protein